MFGSEQDAVRVGFWAVIVAALAGLIVLVAYGRAQAGPLSPELGTLDELAQQLSERTPRTAKERLAQAQAELRAERKRRALGITGTVFDTGVSMWTSSSPRRLVRKAADLFRGLADLRERPSAEDRALVWLEPALGTSIEDDGVAALYTALHERERRYRLDSGLDGAESAFERGHLRLARIRAQRALERDPDSERAARILAEIEVPTSSTERPKPAPVRDWEARLAAALLTGDYVWALQVERSDPDVDLARAVASYLTGHEGEALASLAQLADREDSTGEIARGWMARTDVNVELGLERAERRYRRDRALGWIGGEELASDGFELSKDAYDAWRKSIAPANLAMSAPLRVRGGWHPDRAALRSAALRYLEVLPEGDHSEEASDWLDDLGTLERTSAPGWDDGRFVLPPARTKYESLKPQPVILTREVLDSETIGDVEWTREALGDAPALRLVPVRGANAGVDSEDARVLLADLARALEQRTLEPRESTRPAALEAIRRLDRGLRVGTGLAIEPWYPEGATKKELLHTALLAGDSSTGRATHLERTSDAVEVDRGFGADGLDCPQETVCIDRERVFGASLYGSLDLGADFRVGAKTRFKRASVALEVGRMGPQASLVLPVGHWLHIERWVPLEARLSVGLEGVSFDPRRSRAD